MVGVRFRILLFMLAFVAGACSPTDVVDSTTTGAAETTTSLAPTTSLPLTTTTAPAPAESADVVYTGGAIVTMDDALGTAGAIAITSDRIVAVGSAPDIERYIGPDTVVIDLDGAVVAPGFVDSHTHILTDTGDFLAGQREALAVGITTLADGSVEPEVYDAFVAAAAADQFIIRTGMYLTRTDPCGADMGDWYFEHPAGETHGDRLWVAGVKVFADGGVCGTAALSETFIEGYVPGPPFQALETLTEWVDGADAAGYQMLIHAQGDLAIENVMNAYEAVYGATGNPLRHRIDHNSIPRADLLPRYGELNVVPTVFAFSPACDADAPWTDFFKENGDRPGMIAAANPELVVAWHGDDPWAPPVSPILDMYGLVTRDEWVGDGSWCPAPDWLASGGVASIAEAWKMTTINGAYALRIEDQVGSLVPGKKADLVVLSGNPLTVPIEEVPDITVVATTVNGVVEHCVSGFEAVCPGVDEPTTLVGPSASASRPGQGPELAFDAIAEGDSFWSSGGETPQWIQFTMPDLVGLTEIRGTVFQNPPSDTVHEIEVRIAGEWVLVHTWSGFTSTGDVLTWTPDAPVVDVEAFRITTTVSDSWPEWFDIEFDT